MPAKTRINGTHCEASPLKQRGCNTCWARYQREWRQKNRDRSRDLIYGSSLRARFGIELDAYNELLRAQSGVCAICGGEEQSKNSDGSIRRLQIDHDHATGHIRGLLCTGCNRGLAGFRDDALPIEKAIRDLQTRAAPDGNRSLDG